MNPKPEITISTTDADRLDRLLASLPRAAFPGRAALEAELARRLKGRGPALALPQPT